MIDSSRADAVRAAIYQAFGDSLQPRADEIISKSRTRDFEAEERVRDALAGKSWQSLDTPFVERWLWSFRCYLSPKAYCYYLPALLIAALDPVLDPGGLPFSVLLSLGVDFYHLYFTGDDCRLRQRQALLNDAQYEVVSEFLGLFFTCDEPDGRYNYGGYSAAQALYWGWNRLDRPALRAARQYYHRLHHFTYPESADPQVAALCAELRAAFADTPYPGDDQLAGISDNEATEIGVEFRGLRWQSVHPRLLAYQYSATTFLSDAGLRYFLPAFLMADLHYYDSGGASIYESNAEPVYELTQGWDTEIVGQSHQVTAAELEEVMGKERLELLDRLGSSSPVSTGREDAAGRFAAYTHPERLAIIHYLEYRAENDGYDAPRIEAALESYWRPSVDAGF